MSPFCRWNHSTFKFALCSMLCFSSLYVCEGMDIDRLRSLFKKKFFSSESELDIDDNQTNKQSKKQFKPIKPKRSLPNIPNKTGYDRTTKEIYTPKEIYESNVKFFDKKAKKTLSRHKKGILIMQLGDSSLLIKLDGHNILINPNFSVRRPVVTSYTFLETIHTVLITDSHYLDKKAFRQLALFQEAKPKKSQPTIIAPKGFKNWLTQLGIHNNKIVELQPWQVHSAKKKITRAKKKQKKITRSYSFRLLPSNYYPQSPYKSGSFLITYKKEIKNLNQPISAFKETELPIYFSGQTGQSKCFKQIAKKYSIDIAFFPIAPKSTLLKNNKYHMSYETAKDAFSQLKAKYFIPLFSPFDKDYKSNIDSTRESLTGEDKTTIIVPFVGERPF